MKIWDFGSGQEIKSKPGRGSDEQDLSVLGLEFCEINQTRCLIVLGWNNKLKVFEVLVLVLVPRKPKTLAYNDTRVYM